MTDTNKPIGRSRRARPAAPTTPDPIEIAMEAEASGKAPTGEASALLRRQAVLIDEQIALSREQIGLARNERFRNRIRSIRDLAIAVLVVALVLAAGGVVWSASRTGGLVIQPFTVPPQLVEDGLDGRAVAALFQDELVRLDTTSGSARPSASFRNDWSEGITVEVEAGGLSLKDAYRALIRWLGDETYIDGGISRTNSGLELVVRSSDGTTVRVEGSADRPAELMREAAVQFYERTQPYRYAIYLVDTGEALPKGSEQQRLFDRSRIILTKLLDSPSKIERIWANNGLSVGRDKTRQEALFLIETALEIDPDHPAALNGAISNTLWLSRDESSKSYAQRLLNTLSIHHNRTKLQSAAQEDYAIQARAYLAEFQGDWQKAAELYTVLINRPSPVIRRNRSRLMMSLIALHQPSVYFQTNSNDKRAPQYIQDFGEAGFALSQFDALASLDNWQQALSLIETLNTEQAPAMSKSVASTLSTLFWPRLAYARARTGDLAGAQALIAATPLDCYLCVRERARIAELAGDRAAADRWSAEARRQGPSLPFAFAERGQMLMGRGDVDGAIDFYEQAVERGPRWADPQKYWGDALLARGDEGGAIRKYRAAADRAPQWGALHLAWGRALEAQGRRDQARDKYTEAARMDLSAADRAEVVRRLGART